MGMYKVKVDSSAVRLFESYLSECKINGIEVILVNTPVFIEGQRFVENWCDIMVLYHKLSKKYNISIN